MAKYESVDGVVGGVGSVGDEEIAGAVAAHERVVKQRLERLWSYYRNPLRVIGGPGVALSAGVGRWYRQAQEVGLPARIVGVSGGLNGVQGAGASATAREAVIENDIAWRVQTMVDFLFGKPVRLVSVAREAGLRGAIERVLDRVWEASGGVSLLQDIGTLGHVFGHVDLLVRVDEGALADAAVAVADAGEGMSEERIERVLLASDAVRIEMVDPRRGVAVLDEGDARKIRAYVLRTPSGRRGEEGKGTGVARAVDWLMRGFAGGESLRAAASGWITEVITDDSWRVYDGEELVSEVARGGVDGSLPVVHIQNASQPFEYGGLGEVEPLVPLQDELNTRLSDRAFRVSMQSFKMYLAKGIEGIDKTPIAPGQVWYTDNAEASITSFGGDAATPGEHEHIAEVREALDKVSGVPPLAGGVVQARIGNLSSANALKITLMGLIAKTERKKVQYGRGLGEFNALVLDALDAHGAMQTVEDDRGTRVAWSTVLPGETQHEIGPGEYRGRSSF